jgi:hypothetical protein
LVILVLTPKCLVSRLHAVFLSSRVPFLLRLRVNLFCRNLRVVSLKVNERAVLILLLDRLHLDIPRP